MPLPDSPEYQTSSQQKLALYDALASNRGLQHIVNTAFSIMGNPIFVVDSGYYFLARQASPCNDDSPFSRELYRDMHQDRLEKDQIRLIQNWSLDDRTYQSRGIYIFYNEGFETRAMLSFIRLRGSIVAHMMMLELRSFTAEQEECFAFLASVISQELQKDAFKLSLEYQKASEMLFHLLNTRKPDPEVLEKRLALLQIHLKDKFRIAVVRSRDGILKSLQASSVCRQIQTVFPDCIYTLYENALVFLMEFDADQPLKRDVRSLLRKKALYNNLLMGVSNEFSKFTEIQLFYRQAKQAIDLGLRSSIPSVQEDAFFPYEDFAFLDLLDTASHGAELKRFCHPYLMQLMRYDQENRTRLLETLYIFLSYGRSVRETAAALFIHKNTVAYRLEKAKELLEDSLSDDETLFQLSLSFRILIFLGLFNPPES